MRTLRAGLALAFGLTLLSSLPAAAADRDGDGLRDFFEKKWGVTDFTKRDSDGDGVIDSAEDNDNDRLSDLGEQRFRRNPGDPDTDGDGKIDGNEDKDGDGRTDAREQDQRPLPAGMKPTLGNAKADYPAIRSRCFALLGEAQKHKCVFGDTSSDTTVVLWGDSHAMMWTPAMIPAAKKEGWRLVTFLKGGCPSIFANSKGQWAEDKHRSCKLWRKRILSWLKVNEPDLIILTNSDGYKLVGARGRVLPASERPARYKRGLEGMLAALPDASTAMVLGDAPENRLEPIKCLSSHRRNMSACQTRRQPPRLRPYEKADREAAADAGAEFRTLYNKVCTYDPCPLVQGDILMWRDRGHLTKRFVKRLTPSMRQMLRTVLEPASASVDGAATTASTSSDGGQAPW